MLGTLRPQRRRMEGTLLWAPSPSRVRWEISVIEASRVHERVEREEQVFIPVDGGATAVANIV